MELSGVKKNPPYRTIMRTDGLLIWSWRWDSNPRPAHYECAALPTELRQQKCVRIRKST